MEISSSVWQIGLIALVAGALIGALAYRLISNSSRKTEQIRSELDETRDELAAYKASVQTHFDKTSELVNELTQNYARVYQHLAEGAHTLGDSQALNNLLEQQPGRVLIAVDEETTQPDPLADELATAQSQMSIDVPLGEDAVRADPDDALRSEAQANTPLDREAAEVALDAAEQVGWEPKSPAPAESASAAPPAPEDPEIGPAGEPSFEATQRFVAGTQQDGSEETAAESAETDAGPAAGDSAGKDSAEEARAKSGRKETEPA